MEGRGGEGLVKKIFHNFLTSPKSSRCLDILVLLLMSRNVYITENIEKYPKMPYELTLATCLNFVAVNE